MTCPGRSHAWVAGGAGYFARTTLLIALLICTLFAPWAPALPVFASNSGTPVATPNTLPEGTPVTVADKTTVTVAFPTGLHISGTLVTSEQDARISFLYQTGYENGWNLVDIPASDRSATGDVVTIDTLIDLQTLQVPLGAHLRYRWLIEAQDGTTQSASAVAETDWYDDRQPWQTLTSADITLHTYGMTSAFAGAMLDSAQKTVDDLKTRFDLSTVIPLTLWIYPDANTFQEGLPANFRESVVGGSVVGYPLITAVIPPGSTSEIGRVIPHEISHQMLFQATRNPFTLVPTWFDEGLATHIQIGGTSGYMGMVIAAEQRGGLFDLTSLSESFPYTASQASLAYAASWSAVEYIEQRWGENGIISLIHAFAQGLPEDQATQQALGISMTTFDHDWKDWIAKQG